MVPQKTPVLGQINIVVTDMQASVAFYRKLGFEIDTSHPFSEHHVSVHMPNGFLMELDSAEFANQWNKGCSSTNGPSRNVIGFNVETREAVDEIFELLISSGHVAQQPPFDAFWGARYAIVEDPDKNPVGLMSPIDPQRRGAA